MRHLAACAVAMVLLYATAAVADGDAGRGRKLFRQCAVCHTLAETKREKFGPSLAGIFGRKAAMIEAYPYSGALRDSEIVWTEATLDSWIADPRAFVPGSAMRFPGLPDAQDRADLITYLQAATER